MLFAGEEDYYFQPLQAGNQAKICDCRLCSPSQPAGATVCKKSIETSQVPWENIVVDGFSHGLRAISLRAAKHSLKTKARLARYRT